MPLTAQLRIKNLLFASKAIKSWLDIGPFSTLVLAAWPVLDLSTCQNCKLVVPGGAAWVCGNKQSSLG